MNSETKETLAGIGICGLVVATLGAIIVGTSTVEKKRNAERRTRYNEHNDAIDAEISSIGNFSVNDLINRIVRSSWIDSGVKRSAVNSIKSGRNKIDSEAAKQIYSIVNNNFIDDYDKSEIVWGICDGHVKTKEELELETQENCARYEYLKHKESEETKREKDRWKYREYEKDRENSLKKTRIIADATREVLTNVNINKLGEKSEEKDKKKK